MTDAVKDGGEIVVVGNLGGILLTLQAELLAYELVAKGAPVVVGISHVVGIEIARCAAELSGYLRGLEGVELLGEPVHIHHYLLAETRWRRWLAVGLGEHRHVFPLIGVGLELGDELLNLRIEHIMKRLLQRQWH